MENTVKDFEESLSIDCYSIESIDECAGYLTADQNFKLMTFNIRSIQHNFDSFMVSWERLNTDIDVLILTECWLNDNSIVPVLPGYNSFRTNKYINKNGGVIAYVKNTLNAFVQESPCEDCNCLEVTLSKELMVLGIYRSPSFKDAKPFLKSLESILHNTINVKHLILAGDLNLDICSMPLDEQCADYLCLLAKHKYLPAMTKPTRENACLDHIFIKNPNQALGLVCLTDITDHYMCVAGTRIGQAPQKTSRLRLRTDYDAVVNELCSADWSIVTNSADVNDAEAVFSNIIGTAINRNTSLITISRSKLNLKPWITPGLIKCQKNRDRLHLEAKRNPKNRTAQVIYKRYRNYLNGLLFRLKTSYENQLLTSNKDNPKKLWSSIKNICHLNKVHSQPTELLKTKCDSQSSLNYCNSYLSSIGKTLANVTLDKLSTTQSILAAQVKIQNHTSDSFFMYPTDEGEVDTLISDLKSDSSPGLDRCTPVIIKRMKHTILKPLTHIFNLSVSSGIFPAAWKVALVIPIHKNGDKSNPGNYRPISLLPLFSKLLEKLVNKRLVSFLNKYNIIPDRQFGFRRGKSTEDAALLLTNTISNALDRNKLCLGVFLDLAKAFDTVSAPILLQKLHNIGVRGVAHDWFHSYLSERRQLVRIGSDFSDLLPVEFGVPQGSTLGPTLFLLYMTDIFNIPLDAGEIICYADDTVIVFQDTTWEKVYEAAEQSMAKVNDWLERNLLTLNLDKTKYIAFHKTRASQPPSVRPLKLLTCSVPLPVSAFGAGHVVNRVTSIKYLGVIFDEHLSFRDHISSVSARTRKIIYIVRCLRNSADKENLLMVYKALCQSLLIYCVRVWGGATKTAMLSLERSHRAVLKVMLRKSFRHPTDLLYSESKLLSVRQLFILRASMAMHSETLRSPVFEQLIQKRVYKIPIPSVRTTFANRLPLFLLPYVYNVVCRNVPHIKDMSTKEAKRSIESWLLTLDYDKTEQILLPLS